MNFALLVLLMPHLGHLSQRLISSNSSAVNFIGIIYATKYNIKYHIQLSGSLLGEGEMGEIRLLIDIQLINPEKNQT